MLNLGAAAVAIDLMATTVTRRRYSQTGYAPDGTYNEEQGAVDTTIKATVQPFASLSQNKAAIDLLSLPEGERLEDLVNIWTRAELRSSDEATGSSADEVVMSDGRRFKVLTAAYRPEAGYTRAIAGLIHDRGRSL